MADNECVNPLLLGFLKEWYDRARQQNSKGITTYKNAYEAMRVCRTEFQHPSEAGVLKGLGPGLCSKLTQAMNDHCKANGLPMPKKINKRCRAPNDLDGEEPTAGEGVEPAPPPKKKKPTKAYIPMKRSGAYAILYALYKGEGDTLTKTELIDRARPYCNTSFDAPSEAGRFHTAWNSMKTLIEKNYVYSSGNPKRYMLTDAGEEVGRGIVTAEEGPGDGNGNSNNSTRGVGGGANTRAPAGRKNATKSSSGASSKRKRVPAQADCDEWSDGDGSDSTSRAPSRRRQQIDREKDAEDNRRIMQRKFQEAEENARASDDDLEFDDDPKRVGRNLARLYQSMKPVEYGTRLPVPPPKSRTPPPVRPAPLSRNEIDLTLSPERPSAPALTQRSQSSSNIPTIGGALASRASSVTSIDCSVPVVSRPQSRSGSATISRVNPGGKPIFPDFTPEVIKAGSFTVHLVLDNREVRAKNDRDYIQDNLKACGVNPITRQLQVGDAMWIAREKGGRNREVVLNHIIERKRLDDLVASIKDGRFHEQKFRLAKSGLKHVTYIIEEFTLKETDRAMQDAIDTAISSTQVVSGFFVKKTGKLDDTIRYLARMTKRLEKQYETKDLTLIPDNLLDSNTYQAFRKHLNETFPEKEFNINVPTFSTLVSKSANMTLRDVYLKMLMCVRGICLEKALEMQKFYPTPVELVEAYERCADEDEMKEMIAKKFENAIGRKKIGAAISAKVAGAWVGVGGQEDLDEETEETG